MEIEVSLDSVNGPKVVASTEAGVEEILSALPDGWTVNDDDWGNGVTLSGGRIAYPLSEAE
jgi:hypothetical protein